MASSFIELPESLRPWRTAGVQAVLSPFSKVWEPIVKKHLHPITVLFTYEELGYDLTGKSSPIRSKTLRELISYLAWPKGTVGYWPIAIPAGDRVVIDLSGFWLAARLMRAKHIVCFGESAYEKLCGSIEMHTTHANAQRPACVLSPSLESLSELDEAARLDAFSLLKSLSL